MHAPRNSPADCQYTSLPSCPLPRTHAVDQYRNNLDVRTSEQQGSVATLEATLEDAVRMRDALQAELARGKDFAELLKQTCMR